MIFRKNHSHEGAVTIHSRGGIGNQLFIFGAGLALADQLKCPLVLDSSQHEFTKNLPFLLDNLIPNFSRKLQEQIRFQRLRYSKFGRYLLKKSIPHNCAYNEQSFRFDPSFFALQPNTCVFGYLQSWKYLERLSISRVSEIQSAIHQLGKSKYSFNPNDIVLHFRRGDYLNPGTIEVHGVLGFEYYVRSINHLREMGFSGNIWSISESKIADIDSLEYAIGGKVKQINGLSIWQDLSLLIEAPSLVIANSTFSWMGGWLGSLDRPVFAPNPWFKTQDYDASDLIPANWEKILHDFQS